MMFLEKAKSVKKPFEDQIKEKLAKEKEKIDKEKEEIAKDAMSILWKSGREDRAGLDSLASSAALAVLPGANVDKLNKLKNNRFIIVFNYNPQEAMDLLFDRDYHRIIGAKDNKKARFLVLFRYFLDPQKVDEYLKTTNETIRSLYHQQLSEANKQTNKVLSGVILGSLKLPKEEEIIKKLINFFSNYYKNNPYESGKSVSNDDVRLLFQTILKLNDATHDPKVKKKMTIEEFLSALKRTGINEDLLEQIYKDVRKNKIVIKVDHTDIESQVPRHRKPKM